MWSCEGQSGLGGQDSLVFSYLRSQERKSQSSVELPMREGVTVVGKKFIERRYVKFLIKDWW